MLGIRIIALGAVLALPAAGAVAQTGDETSPGKPLQLLQMLKHKPASGTTPAAPTHKHANLVARSHASAAVRVRPAATARSHASLVTRSHAKTASAKRPQPAKRVIAHHVRPKIVKTAAVTGVVSDAGIEPDITARSGNWPPAPEPIAAAVAPNGAAPTIVNVAGQSIEIAAPDEINIIDLAATEPPVTPSAETTADAPEAAQPADAAPAADLATPAAKIGAAIAALPMQASAVPTARSAWMEALAALGGAVAAASAAWFLFGSAPWRRYS